MRYTLFVPAGSYERLRLRRFLWVDLVVDTSVVVVFREDTSLVAEATTVLVRLLAVGEVACQEAVCQVDRPLAELLSVEDPIAEGHTAVYRQ